MENEDTTLDKFLKFADSVQVNADRARRPIYAETCSCGGSIEIGIELSAAERKRNRESFVNRHFNCVKLTKD